ncbi:MAG: GntR family transcriptional regulator [Thermoplasmataceae archaeon]
MVDITVDHNSSVPLYKQIYDQVVLLISKGELAPGDSLPSTRIMAGILEINYHTVNQSYQMLRENGILSMARNKKYVISRSNRATEFRDTFRRKEEDMISEAMAMGMDKEQIIEEVKTILEEKLRKNSRSC